jgi:hypothetical protein
LSDAVLVRDSKQPDGPAVEISVKAWSAFTARVKDGTFGA